MESGAWISIHTVDVGWQCGDSAVICNQRHSFVVPVTLPLPCECCGLPNGLNIILDPLLIFGWGPIPTMGIEGCSNCHHDWERHRSRYSAMDTFKGGRHIQVLLTDLVWDAKRIINIIKTSLGGVGQMIVAMSSWIFLMRILADVGSEAVAGSNDCDAGDGYLP